MFDMLTGEVNNLYSELSRKTFHSNLQPPFTARSRDVTIKKVLSSKLKLPNHLTRDAQDLIRKLLRKQPSARLGTAPLGATAIKQHLFFKSVVWNDVINRKLKPPFKPNLVRYFICLIKFQFLMYYIFLV